MIALATLAARALLKDLAWRAARLTLKLAFGVLLLVGWGGCVGQHAILVEEMQPGGRARLVQSGVDISLEGPTRTGGTGLIGPQAGAMLPQPPPEQWAAMVAASANAPCRFPGPEWLAALAWYESAYGRNPGPSSAGAWGYGQFMPATLTAYGISRQDALDYRVMLPQMVRYLCAAGIATNIDGALFAYNHSLAYVEHVKALVASWVTAASAGWHDHPAVNQYLSTSWENQTNWKTWAAAACSAAALQWMLVAYGHPISLDGAVGLIGPYAGINPSVGLMDHTGAPLSLAVGRAGMTAWRQRLTSSAQLRQRLLQGPAMLDGQLWFGVGHWFVAVGSDEAGVQIRESSGNNVQYLTWARLYGEVGWSGWAVGISSAAVSNQA